jgi:hypothetical protein
MTTPSLERPGIYINETLTPLAGAPGVPGQSVATFAGLYNIGPTVPTLITSWNEYTQTYGSFAQANGNYLHYAVYQFFNNGGSACYVLRVPNSDAVAASLVLQDVNTPPDNALTVSAISPGAWGNNLFVAITTAGNPGRFNVTVYNGGTTNAFLVENFIDLSINPSDTRNVVNVINSPIAGSDYISVVSTLPGAYTAGVSDLALISPSALTGGGDGVTAPDLTQSIPTSLDMLSGTILNLNVPALTNTSTVNALLTWAAGRGDVMMVIDGPSPTPPESSAQVVQNYVGMVTGGSPITASSYASLYAPWIQITDPSSSLPNATRWVPPGGAVLGVWSNTDNNTGPYQTPAGITYGGINLVNVEARFTPTDQANLNANNINAIRFVNGNSYIMGGRTLAQGYPDRYLAVRRMLIQLEHDFTDLLQFALFEPNDQTLWDQIDYTLDNYLNGLTQQGVLGGSTNATAYTIVCDSSNNTPASAGSGIVNVTVAVALTSPAEFIIINIQQQQNTGNTTVTTSTQ